ncbi:MAG: rhodanese-like domain-containing protein [Ilumatobacter sp.]
MARRDHPITDYRAVVDESTQLVDVRQPEELVAGTLDGAINIPLDRLAERIGELDPARRTVMLCRSGGRSAKAADELSRAGFVDVVNLEGGMIAYTKESTS